MTDIRIVLTDGRILSEVSAEERKLILGQFGTCYVAELEKELLKNPEQYAWSDKSHEEVQRVASRMIDAIYHGRANNSNALKRAAKKMGMNGAMMYMEAFVRQCILGIL